MTEAGEYECRLLADLLESCILIADFFASSKDQEAEDARADTDAQTFHSILHYEFCRLHAGLVAHDDGLATVLGVGVTPLLEVLESRAAKPKFRLRKGPFDGLEALRSKIHEPDFLNRKATEKLRLRQQLRLSPSSSKTRKLILQCLANCNPEDPIPLDPIQDGEKGISASKASKSPVAKVSKLVARSHQLLCKHWACTCLPAGSHVAAKLLLTTYRSNKLTNTMRLELLLSTSDEKCPWEETEIEVITDSATTDQGGTPIHEKEKRQRARVDSLQVQDHRVRFAGEKRESHEEKSKKDKRFEVKNICTAVHNSLGNRLRLLVEGNSLFRLRNTGPKIKNLDNAVHISLRDLIQNGHLLQMISEKERFILTYIIASSILSLYRGPWLDHSWTKDQIFFLSQGGDLQTINLRKPLLSTKCIAKDHRECESNPDDIHPEPPIAALGIVMLEIARGMVIESRRDDGPLNSNTDLLLAYNLLEEFEHSPGAIPNHILAIRTCLKPEEILQEDFSDEAKRQILHANVVEPLEKILEAFGESLENLNTVLGGDLESTVPVTRSTLRTRNSSSTSIRSFGSTSSLGITPELVELSSVDMKTDPNAMPAARWFQDLETYVHPLTAVAPIPRVKIAILDSGIDLPEEIKWAHPDRITYRSWIEGDDTNGTDLCGHGTHAAGLLLQVSDHAEIYVARITQSGKSDELDPNIIAEAITYATDIWKVDIITMSFGFSEPQPVIDTALTQAAGSNTVLLAAASNSGNRHSIAWPARAEQVICIHSLLGDGDRSPFTPNSRPQDFGILGQAVSSYWPSHLNEGSSVLRSGTSCATPIAAGVAALVLEFTQHRLPQRARPGSQVDQHVIRKLRSSAGMRMIFELMAEYRDHQNCIIPWKLLNHERNEQTMCDQILEKLRTM